VDETQIAMIVLVLVSYVALVFSLCVHEAAHALVANWCGDPSARLLGRISLNPLKHIDPIGTVVMPLLMRFTGIPFLFGWAKPVLVNPLNLKNPERDNALIAIAGPVSNLILLVLSALLAQVLLFAGDSVTIQAILFLLAQMIMTNFILAVFNCIPVPPLDGHHVLGMFLPESGQRAMQQIGPFGIIIAILVARPLFDRLDPVLNWLVQFAGYSIT
jgi:Zn-dependent protease